MDKLTVCCVTASILSLSALALVVPTGSQAQTSSTAKCGTEVYSAADQRYVGVPCTAPAPKAEAGKTASCGTEVYSVAEQRYVGVPCPH